MNRRIVVIGGGASGLMAAIQAARCGASVTVLEHNEKPGKKLLAAGNGKCNLTNLALDAEAYQSDAPQILQSVLQQFRPEDTIRWFNRIGLRTFDRQGWVYPCTEQASSVLDLLLWEAERYHVHFKNKEEVLGAETIPGGSGFTVKTKTWQYDADAVILACGSPASAVRGSSEFAARFAEKKELLYKSFIPVLVPLQMADSRLGGWNGTRVHAGAALYIDGKEYSRELGEVQLTSFGVSGIPIFQMSRFAHPALKAGRQVILLLDFLPEMESIELQEYWIEREQRYSSRTYSQLLTGILPDRLIPVVLSAAGLRGSMRPSLADHEENGAVSVLLELLKEFPVRIRGAASMDQAQICTGGICLSQMTETLMCRKHPGLYVTGEAANVDGPCGGYNLQWAWSSGYVAGRAAAEE